MIHNCRKCNVVLTNNNWYNSLQKCHKYICKSCSTEKNKQYQNTQEFKEYQRQYRLSHKEEINEWEQSHKKERKEQQRRFIKKHPEYKKQQYGKYKEYQKEYIKQYLKTPNGKISLKKSSSKRREFGYNPLNNYFEGSHAHHLDKINIIYVSKEINKNIYHNNNTGKNMDIVNMKAWDYLEKSVL